MSNPRILDVACVLACALTTTSLHASFEQRMADERALERVRFEARLWPADNPDPKPAFESAVPERAIRERVTAALKSSSALAVYWSVPLTGAQIQAEIDRMAGSTRDAAMLERLWSALGRDPRRIAEGLARPLLAMRLAERRYAYDPRIHEALRAHAEAGRERLNRGEDPHSLSAFQDETIRPESAGDAPGTVLPLRETESAFETEVVLGHDAGSTRVALLRWDKMPFDRWLATAPGLSVAIDPVPPPDGGYRLPDLAGDSPCTADTWSTLAGAPPEARSQSTAVWTGTEVIVWGGQHTTSFPHTSLLDDGARYNPSTDTWTPIKRAGAPTGRVGHTAVWTGSKMLVWGGQLATLELGDGAAYDPLSDAWSPISSIGAAAPRYGHTAVWTGSKMLVWGGTNFSAGANLQTGGRYDPSTNTWASITTSGAPTGRYYHTAVWAGSRMVVWGGKSFLVSLENTGGRYDPVADTWAATNTATAPEGRQNPASVWTGSRVVIFGGTGGTFNAPLFTGGQYDPVTDSWTPTSTVGVTFVGGVPSAVWTGSLMLVFEGGYTSFRYDPSLDVWTAMSPPIGPTGGGQPAVWMNSAMFAWGGGTNTGGRYDPVTDSWTPTWSGGLIPNGTIGTQTVWTGAEVVVWSGSGSTGIVETGRRYDPALDVWTSISSTGAPPGRRYGVAVWSGREMIVWGGERFGSWPNSGGRYDPASNSWTLTSTTNVPFGRQDLSAVWTGSSMIVWGGHKTNSMGGNFPFQEGGIYVPATDTWTATPLTGAPSARYNHTAVWTGTEMIVWGGGAVFTVPTDGARFRPSTGAWAPMASLSPWGGSSRAAWSGSRMFVDGASASYDPVADAWTAFSSVGAPSTCCTPAGDWTGERYLLWGGQSAVGGSYEPIADAWSPTTLERAPVARSHPAGAWTGTRLFVFGGEGDYRTGGLYCPACSSLVTLYRDADGDGHGNPAVTTTRCGGSPLVGYVATGDDCDDADAITWGIPAEVPGLVSDADKITVRWGIPSPSGGVAPGYDTLRSLLASDFTGAVCVETNDPSDRVAVDATVPTSGVAFFYLVRARTHCGTGGLGLEADNTPRSGRNCP